MSQNKDDLRSLPITELPNQAILSRIHIAKDFVSSLDRQREETLSLICSLDAEMNRRGKE